MSQSPVAERLNAISVALEDTSQPEVVAALKIGAEEVQRLWALAEKRYWDNQRIEGSYEKLEKVLRRALMDKCPDCGRFQHQSYPTRCGNGFHNWREAAWIEIGQGDDSPSITGTKP